MTKIRIFAPAYNVAGSIQALLEEMDDVSTLLKRSYGYDLEMFVINDNSSDNTGAILSEAHAKYPWLSVRHNSENLGNGINIMAGYEWASEADIAGCLDADGEHSPYAMIRHLKMITEGGFDGVVGSIIFPDHDANHHDRNMMRYHGGMQAALAKIDGMFYIQSPGYNLHKAEKVKEALRLLPLYQEFFTANSAEAFPRWGVHGVMIHLLSIGAGARIKAVYLECFGQSPNRSPEKLLLQANAANVHQVMLAKFSETLT